MHWMHAKQNTDPLETDDPASFLILKHYEQRFKFLFIYRVIHHLVTGGIVWHVISSLQWCGWCSVNNLTAVRYINL